MVDAPPYGQLAYEFPEYDVSTLPAIPDWLHPVHWHNDTCPSWSTSTEGNGVEVYIECQNPDDREIPEWPRYNVLPPHDTDTNRPSLIFSEDWQPILAYLESIKEAEQTGPGIAAARVFYWAERIGMGFHPDTRGADYIVEDGSPSFSAEEAEVYDSDMSYGLAMLPDIYETGLEAFKKLGFMD